ncbi:uncharacterized protein METZ01_LOCUS46566 [marine metagenome]|uniref:Uncharacterized protein n=1 Tax=marine metagenome TaxID=408172 RepID=A0A381RP98_9ZZZZ
MGSAMKKGTNFPARIQPATEIGVPKTKAKTTPLLNAIPHS